jgi:hypothetical protein
VDIFHSQAFLGGFRNSILIENHFLLKNKVIAIACQVKFYQFVNVLYGKTDRFHIPTNLPAIADLSGYARSVHDRRGRRVWNMVFGNYVAKPAFFTRTSGLQFCPCP